MLRALEIETALGKRMTLEHLSAHEELGRLAEYQLTLISEVAGISAKDLLGTNITAGIEIAKGKERYINGFITRFSYVGTFTVASHKVGKAGKMYRYQATVHPRLWFLTRTANSRVFQKKSVPDIVSGILAALGLTVEKKLTSTYKDRDYCVQYRETDFNFVSRLLEHEGIYYYFAHDNGGHKIVLCDAVSAHNKFGDVLFMDAASGRGVAPILTDWRVSYEVQAGKYTLNDFDYLKPQTSLEGKKQNPGPGKFSEFEVFDYPGEYHEHDAGASLAARRLEELAVQLEVYHGSGQLRGLVCGDSFKLRGHAIDAYNQEYIVTSLGYEVTSNTEHSGGQAATYHMSVTAIPSSRTFRAARITPKPVIQGPQTAFVVGPTADEVFTEETSGNDKHAGRVKVQFHWDREGKYDANSSCWVRVSQVAAGNAWGIVAWPRVGNEVVVSFLEGDPDRPLITGRVFNNAAPPPQFKGKFRKMVSGIKTQTHGGKSGYNELSFDDEPGKEEIYMHAEKDHNVQVKNDRKEWIGNDSHLIVEKDRLEEVKGDTHLTVKGDVNQKVTGSVSLKSQDFQGKVDTKYAVDAGTEVHFKAGTTLVLEAGTMLGLKVGGNFITINSAGVFIKGIMVMINSGGAAANGSGASPQAPKAPEKARDDAGGKKSTSNKPKKATTYSPQAQALKLAAQNGTPFCEECAKAAAPGPG